MSARGPLAAFAAFGAFWGGWAVLVPTLQTAIGASKGQLGLALLGVGLGSLPAMPAAGRLIDRGARGVLPLSFAALAFAGLLPGVVSTPVSLGLVLVVVGACTGAADVAVNARVAALEAAGGRRLMQLAHALFSLGLIAGAVAAGVLRQLGVGRLGVLAVLGCALLVAAVVNRGAEASRPAAAHDGARRRLSRRLLLLGVACAGGFAVESGMEVWSALFLQRELGAGAALSAVGPASYASAMATGRLLGHRVGERLGDTLLYGAGAVVAAVGLAAASLAGSVGAAAVAFFVGGMGVSITAPTLFGAAGRTGGASAVATLTTVGYLGFVVGPPVVGGLASAVGLRGAFAALAGVALLLAVAAPRLGLAGPRDAIVASP